MERLTLDELEIMTERELHAYCLMLIGYYYDKCDWHGDKALISTEVCTSEQVQAAYNVALGLNDMGASPEDAYRGVLVTIAQKLQERVLR